MITFGEVKVVEQCDDPKETWVNGHHVQFMNHLGWHCDCKAYKFSKGNMYQKTCMHITQAKMIVCRYHEQLDGSPNVSGTCPWCGGDTKMVRIGE